MYGNIANKLILDAKRSSNLADIPLYQHELVRDIVKETLDLNKDVEYLTEQQQLDEELYLSNSEQSKVNQCQLFVTHLCMRRNKRCLLAHEKLRADKIDEFTWLNIDPIVNTADQENQIRGNNQLDASNGSANSNANSTAGNSAIGATAVSFVAGSVGGGDLAQGTTRLSLDNLNHAEQEYFKNYQKLVMLYKSNFPDLDLSGDLEPPTNIFIDVRVLRDGGEVQTEYGVFNLIKDSQFYVRKSDVERLIQQGYLEEI